MYGITFGKNGFKFLWPVAEHTGHGVLFFSEHLPRRDTNPVSRSTYFQSFPLLNGFIKRW